MKEYLKAVFRKLFYRVSEAEHFRFAGYNEFLIIHLRFFLPFVPLKDFICESAIGNPTGHQFADQIQELGEKGIKLTSQEFSREEFDRIARSHLILRNDSWVRQRLMALDTGIAREYS